MWLEKGAVIVALHQHKEATGLCTFQRSPRTLAQLKDRSYIRLLGMFFTQFTLMNISFCAWQQHSDAFREHSSVFRDTFTVLNYPRPTYPSAWRALSPSLLLAVTLPCSQRVCTNWLLSAFPHFWYVSFSSNSSLGKTEGYQGKTTDASFLSIALISLTMSN